MLVPGQVPDCRAYFQFSASKQVSALKKNGVVVVCAAKVGSPPFVHTG